MTERTDIAPATATRDEKGRWVKGSGSPNPSGLPRAVRLARRMAAEDGPRMIAVLWEYIERARTPTASRADREQALEAMKLLTGIAGLSPLRKLPDEDVTDADLAKDVTELHAEFERIGPETLRELARQTLVEREERETKFRINHESPEERTDHE